MKNRKSSRVFLSVLGVVALGIVAGCASPRADATFAKYDDVKEVKTFELACTSRSWDGAELPDYPVGKPQLIVKRYVFPRGSKLGWHHHPVMNYGILQQGELTIIGLDGKEKTVRAGEAVVEMVGTIHHGENRGDKTVVLDMFYISQEGTPTAVQHPEIKEGL
ncbi:MAG: cupin domain-containing protein [Kiritimatiellae bacterium]|nr:cupin domain-containing protein [Kiritimatiellia bacterium]